MAGTDSIQFDGPSVPDWALVEHRDGFVVGVTGVLRTGDVHPPPDVTPGAGTPTAVPFLDLPFSAWYYLTPEFTLRKQREEGEGLEGVERPEPDLSTAETIVCDR